MMITEAIIMTSAVLSFKLVQVQGFYYRQVPEQVLPHILVLTGKKHQN